ncbi:MAG TPA: DinB family protein [Saprospiraceae bacterium]|nr:DinB family protein [Saprospiraceae bacterium]
MNHTYFIEIAKFNQWANHVVISWLREISDEQWKAEVISSFNSVGDTAIHIIGAEKIWLQRLQKQSHPEWFPAVFKGTRTEALDAWQEAAEGLLNFVMQLNEEDLLASLHYTRINGDAYTQPVYKVLAHVFNHSTYHRGQLVTQLRQVGYEGITTTDLLAYYNLKF